MTVSSLLAKGGLSFPPLQSSAVQGRGSWHFEALRSSWLFNFVLVSSATLSGAYCAAHSAAVVPGGIFCESWKRLAAAALAPVFSLPGDTGYTGRWAPWSRESSGVTVMAFPFEKRFSRASDGLD